MQNEPTSSKSALNRATSSAENQEKFMLSRQKSKRRESRMYIVDGQLCWADSDQAGSFGGIGSKRNSSMGLLFGSSMDLSGISMMGHSIDSSGGAGSGSEEAISYRIKWCRENIMQLKRQTWPMEKKLQVLKASKLFIKQHQGELKQSKQAKDVIASTSAIFDRYWRHFKREFANFLVIITPWEMRIKKIESHFGSVVASYFTFLRWIFWLNLANSLVLVTFVMVPELIENAPDLTGMRKGELGMQQPIGADGAPAPRPEFNPTLGEMWEFEGFLKFSPIFYGYYSNVEISRSGFWRNPLAFLLSAVLSYLFCFFCISRKLSQNTKQSRIGSKDDEYTFCWTVFVGWDFMIGNSETAYNKTSSLVMNLKEGILEEKEQVKDRDWRLIIRRVMANVLTLMLIIASAYVVTLAVQRSENLPEDASLLQKNELQLVMSGIQFMFPPLFDVIGIIEKYHPRKALSWQLGRILFLDFLNFYTLMFSLFGTVDQMGDQLNEVSGNITLFRKNTTYWNSLFTTTTTLAPETTTIQQQLNDSSSSSSSSAGNSSNRINSLNNTTQPNTWLADTVTSDAASSQQAAGANLNASTILTTVLLASSTVMPSSTGGAGDSGGDSIASTTTMLSAVDSFSQQATTSTLAAITMSSSAFGGSPTMIGETATFAGTTLTGTSVIGAPAEVPGFSAATMTQPQITTEPTTAATTLELQPTTASSRASTEDSDQDYPDLTEVLGKVSNRLRKRETDGGVLRKRKRRPLTDAVRVRHVSRAPLEQDRSVNEVLRFDVVEHHEGTADNAGKLHYPQSEELVRRTSTAPPPPPHNQFHGAFIPPIQDPYRKVGVRMGDVYPFSMASGEEEEEEPLEGRLEPTHIVRKPPVATRRPAAKSHVGIARPIGGVAQHSPRGSRVQMTKPPVLDDDANEDILEPAEAPVIGSSSGTTTTGSNPVAGGDNFGVEVRPEASEGYTEPTTSGAPNSNPESQQENLSPELSTSEPNGQPIEPTDSSPDRNGNGNSSASDNSSMRPQAKSALGPASNEEPQQASGTATGRDPALDVTSCAPSIESSTELRYPNGTSIAFNLKSSVGFNASEVTYTDCIEIPDFKHPEILALNDTFRDKLKSLCWETMFGQEMVKIVVMDLVMTVMSAVSFEFMRACFVRYCNRFFFWDLERGFPGYQDFKIAENVLHLVNNQSSVWMGMFFAPGLPAINTVKLAILMYVRSWAVLTCNIPHETVFKVSKSNNFYYWILLINLLICILPVAYAVTWIRPSWHCGPFGGECRMYLVMTKLVKSMLPPEANTVFRYITSPGAVIPILISLILIIYYLASTVSSSKEANKELKAQLKKDKEQEAAVPEITNTTVADSAPTSGAAAAASSPAAAAVLAPAPAAPLAALNPNNLAPSVGAPSEGAPMQQHQPTESRPKSLLMPPPP